MKTYWCKVELSSEQAESVHCKTMKAAAERFAKLVISSSYDDDIFDGDMDVFVSEDTNIWYHYVVRIELTADSCDDNDCEYCKEDEK